MNIYIRKLEPKRRMRILTFFFFSKLIVYFSPLKLFIHHTLSHTSYIIRTYTHYSYIQYIHTRA